MGGTNVGKVFMSLELNGQNNFKKAINNTAMSSQKSMGSAMGAIGGFVAKAFAVGSIIAFSKASLNAASMSQSAWTGLNSIIKGQGRSFKEAEGFINDYISDGLVPLTNAVGAYKNLALRGYDTKQIEMIMERFKDSAAFSRQASYSMGEAIQTATEGLKNENSVVVDNVGVTKNVAKMWDEYARSIGTTASNLTLAQKRQAEVNGILAETAFQVGDAKAYTETYAGKVAQLSTAFMNLKIAVGSVVAPIVSALIPALTAAMNMITRFFNYISQLLAVFGIKFPKVIEKGGAGAMKSLGASAGDATKKMGGVGKQASKTAKEIKRAFASVDDLNIVNIPDDTSASAGGGAGGGVDTSGSPDMGQMNFGLNEDVGDQLSEWAVKFKKQIQDIWSVLSETKSWKAFKSIGVDTFKTVLQKGKEIFGSFKTIFSSLGTEFVKQIYEKGPEIDNAFASLFTGIKDVINVAILLLIEPFNGLMSGIAEVLDWRAPELMESLFNIFLPITEFIGETMSNLSQPIIELTEDINTAFSILGELATNMLIDLTTGLADHIPGIVSSLTNMKDSFVNIFSELTSIVGEVWTDFCRILSSTWFKYGEEISQGIGEFLQGVTEIFEKLWTEVLEPIIKPFLEDFKTVWRETLEPTIKAVFDFIGKLVAGAIEITNKFIIPVTKLFLDIFKPVITGALTFVGGLFNAFLKTVGEVLQGIMRALGGVVDFITGIFTGNWTRAWTGVQNIFSGIWDSLVALAKAPLNLIITGINAFISGLNAIKIPDWVPGVGGKGFNIARIPMLAQGGYVKANNPQLAIIGDNKREGEIVAPESKLKEMVKLAMAEMKTTSEISLNLKVEYEDGRRIIKKINEEQLRAGEVLLYV